MLAFNVFCALSFVPPHIVLVSLRYIRFLVFSSNFRDIHFKCIYERQHTDENMRAKSLFTFGVYVKQWTSHWFGLCVASTSMDSSGSNRWKWLWFDRCSVFITFHNGRSKKWKCDFRFRVISMFAWVTVHNHRFACCWYFSFSSFVESATKLHLLAIRRFLNQSESIECESMKMMNGKYFSFMPLGY